MTLHPNLSERDLELLSAYLDGELSDRDRRALEQRLAAESDLRRTLDELRATVRLVGSLPRLKAPRNFTLDPAQFQKRAPWWRRLLATGTALQLSGALGTAASIILIVLGLALGPAEEAAPPATVSEAPAAASVPTVLPAPPTLAPTLSPSPFAMEEADQGMAGARADEADDAETTTERAAELVPEPMLAQPSPLSDGAAESFAAQEGPAEPGEAAPQMDTFAPPADTGAMRSGEFGREVPQPEPEIAAQSAATIPPSPQAGEGFAADDAAEPTADATTEELAPTPPVEALQRAEPETSAARPWLIGLGAAGLAISALLLVLGRRQAGV